MPLSKIIANSITDGAITNTQINASASIATSKVASYALPIVFAYSTASQSLTATTWTNVTIGTEVIDTHNIFASSVATLPTGKYLMSATVDLECSSHNNLPVVI